jgi:hypothetical protein
LHTFFFFQRAYPALNFAQRVILGFFLPTFSFSKEKVG